MCNKTKRLANYETGRGAWKQRVHTLYRPVCYLRAIFPPFL